MVAGRDDWPSVRFLVGLAVCLESCSTLCQSFCVEGDAAILNAAPLNSSDFLELLPDFVALFFALGSDCLDKSGASTEGVQSGHRTRVGNVGIIGMYGSCCYLYLMISLVCILMISVYDLFWMR